VGALRAAGSGGAQPGLGLVSQRVGAQVLGGLEGLAQRLAGLYTMVFTGEQSAEITLGARLFQSSVWAIEHLAQQRLAVVHQRRVRRPVAPRPGRAVRRKHEPTRPLHH
jgi:hypothetical protein